MFSLVTLRIALPDLCSRLFRVYLLRGRRFSSGSSTEAFRQPQRAQRERVERRASFSNPPGESEEREKESRLGNRRSTSGIRGALPRHSVLHSAGWASRQGVAGCTCLFMEHPGVLCFDALCPGSNCGAARRDRGVAGHRKPRVEDMQLFRAPEGCPSLWMCIYSLAREQDVPRKRRWKKLTRI